MAQHRRIPKKNRKKLKSVDPFNNKANAARFKDKNKNSNQAPVSLKDEQPLTKAAKNLMGSGITTKEEVKKKKKQKNAVLAQAEELGMKKGKFETVNRFVKRIEGTLHSRINEQIAIAKHGLAGRKQEEIDADYKIIEDAEKRKKEQEKREIENKIKEARKKREQEARRLEEVEKLKEQKKAEKRKMKEALEKEEEEESFDEDEVSEKRAKIEKSTEKGGSEKATTKLSKKDRRKETLKARKSDEQKRRAGEALINSREIIEFGERNDAPPTFGGALKKKFEPLMAKAGQKTTLLLHSMLQKGGGQKTEYLNNSTKIQEERQKVIDAYRDMKKQKRIAAAFAAAASSSSS
ncbi:DUF1014-domain-containing protein [Caenorhabditis elegans]|uniref:DUF1014-domain-containing protein n=2 Tax=Caenorhabditis elegans TaxID=6239 RepID=Q95Y11_CAEEL|nr:DUF1014-domain-containing protein [Caenorhabditis elegans]CCD66711.1 DUF1014-domain-containing protein [Caenorhabditis elegans]|eukprot:NP_500107.1 Uncharacterized protein CELE_Y41D4B.11 [Caenorhabditis elegans]